MHYAFIQVVVSKIFQVQTLRIQIFMIHDYIQANYIH